MNSRILAHLTDCGIQLLAEGKYCAFTRDGFVALVERREEGFGAVGGAGLVTENGLAYLIWQEGRPWFINKTHRLPAGEEQVKLLRSFSADLEAALRAA